jgi:hypothetical protein
MPSFFFQISVTAAKTSLEPQQDLKLTVQTEEGSYIGLSCIDQSSMLLKRGNDLSLTRIFNDLQMYDNRGDFDINLAFKSSFVNLLVRLFQWILRLFYKLPQFFRNQEALC